MCYSVCEKGMMMKIESKWIFIMAWLMWFSMMTACSAVGVPTVPGEVDASKQTPTQLQSADHLLAETPESQPTETMPPPSPTQITIDGNGEDWKDRPLLWEDSAGDAIGDYLDITRVYGFVNQDAFYLLIEVVDPGAAFVQIDVDLSADYESKMFNWRPDVENWKQFPRSEVVVGSVLEARIDLRDIGSPENSVIISQVRVMVGENPPSEDWQAADETLRSTKRVTWVNEFDLDRSQAATEEILDSSGRRVNYTTSGYIDEDEIWRGEIHLTGDIEFVNGAVLTIEPGTIVYIVPDSDDRQANDTNGCFSDYTCLHDDPTTRPGWGANTISIDARHGVLNAEGTPDEPIIIKPEGDDTSPSQYGSIIIERGVLKYTKILYSNGVEILGFPNGFEVAYNEIRHCLSTCLSISKDNVIVHHNLIEGGGIVAMTVGNHSIVEHNIFLRSNLAIHIEQREDVLVRNNLILDCSTGIAVNAYDVEIFNNTIAYIEGPPDGIYYQGELVYPLFNSWINEFGIGVDGKVTVINNIISAPYPTGIFNVEYDPRIIVKFNLVYGADVWASGKSKNLFSSSNFEADPMFVDLANGDLRLLSGSPAVDAGFPDLLDPDGSISDIGAYGGPFADGW